MDWLHAGEDLQVAWLEPLEATQTSRDVSSLGFFLYLLREACHFLLQELVISCSLWYLSVSLQFPWCCNKYQALLFPVAPRHLKYADSLFALQVRQDRNQLLGQFSESLGHWTYVPFFSFLPREKLLVGLFILVLLSYAGLGLLWLV